jgi:hypothetical protein
VKYKRVKPERPTRAEFEERTLFMASLLTLRIPKGRLKRQFREEFGADISARTIDRYVARARARHSERKVENIYGD